MLSVASTLISVCPEIVSPAEGVKIITEGGSISSGGRLFTIKVIGYRFVSFPDWSLNRTLIIFS
ncbi:MAG: hypothetical protein ACJZ14_02940 [Candidatus Neomarinimicrobiota bacterium]